MRQFVLQSIKKLLKISEDKKMKKAKKLLKAMPYRALTTASVEEMLSHGISARDADLIYSHFHPKEDTP